MRNARKATAVGILTLGAAMPRVAHADPVSTSPEQAYDLGDVPNARGVAMGGALNAVGVSTTALYANPADMSLARVYHIEALGAYDPASKRQTYGLAVVDSVLNASHVAGGLGATWSQFDPSGLRRTWTDVRAASSVPLGQHLTLGSTVRWLRVEQDVGTGPFGASVASGGTHDAPLLNTLTLDAGATVSTGGARFAVVGHNLTHPGNALVPTTGAAGIGYTSSAWALEADGLLDFTTWGKTQSRLMAGAEVFLADRYALRVGWRYDAGTNLHAPSAGVGYIDPHWSIEFGIRHDLSSDHASTLGVLSLRYFYDPTGLGNPADEPDGN